MMPDEFGARVRQTIAAHRLLAPRSRVVIGVSGGADSVALLQVLAALQHDWDLALHIAHLDHGLRAESEHDAEFVRTLGTHRHIPTTIERREVSSICSREGWSLEDGARRIRYQFLLDVARRQSASAIALAHTADDQAETVLMRLLRGTGLMGLGAIPFKRPLEEVWVVRPLLDVRREDVLAYLERERLTYREDATNADARFVRNRIRHQLLPLLERDYNPNIKGALTQLAEQSRSDYAYLQDAAQRQWKRLANTRQPFEVSLSVAAFLRQPKALQRQLVRQAIQRLRGDLGEFEFRHWLEIEGLFTSRPVGAIVDLPGGLRLHRETDRVRVRLAPTPISPVDAPTPRLGPRPWPGAPRSGCRPRRSEGSS